MNPALERDIKAIPGGYRVRLPAHRIDSFLAAYRRATDTAIKKYRQTSKLRAPTRRTLSRATSIKLTKLATRSAATKNSTARTRQAAAKNAVIGGRNTRTNRLAIMRLVEAARLLTCFARFTALTR